jgi:hypothetical protein
VYDDDFICSANDMCMESKRQTINADDVLKALDEMEFSEFLEPLRTSLQGQSCYCHPITLLDAPWGYPYVKAVKRHLVLFIFVLA